MKGRRNTESNGLQSAKLNIPQGQSKPGLNNQQSATRSKLGALEDFRFILGSVDLEGMGIVPHFLPKAAVCVRIEQFYEHAFASALKANGLSSFDPAKALLAHFAKASPPEEKKIRYWQAVSSFIYSLMKLAESREVALFVGFLQEPEPHTSLLLYILLRQHYKILKIVDPSLESDPSLLMISSENSAKIVEKVFGGNQQAKERVKEELSQAFHGRKQISYYDFLETVVKLRIDFNVSSAFKELASFYQRSGAKDQGKAAEQSSNFVRKPFVLKGFDLEPERAPDYQPTKTPLVYIPRAKTKEKAKGADKPLRPMGEKTNQLETKDKIAAKRKERSKERVPFKPRNKVEGLFNEIDFKYNNKYKGGGVKAKEGPRANEIRPNGSLMHDSIDVAFSNEPTHRVAAQPIYEEHVEFDNDLFPVRSSQPRVYSRDASPQPEYHVEIDLNENGDILPAKKSNYAYIGKNSLPPPDDEPGIATHVSVEFLPSKKSPVFIGMHSLPPPDDDDRVVVDIEPVRRKTVSKVRALSKPSQGDGHKAMVVEFEETLAPSEGKERLIGKNSLPPPDDEYDAYKNSVQGPSTQDNPKRSQSASGPRETKPQRGSSNLRSVALNAY